MTGRLRLSAYEKQTRMFAKGVMPLAEKESPIKKRILDMLAAVPWCRFINTPAGGAKKGKNYFRLAPTGWPDVTGGVQRESDGACVFTVIEVKRPGEKPRASQLEMRGFLEKIGVRWFCVSAVDEAYHAIWEVRKS